MFAHSIEPEIEEFPSDTTAVEGEGVIFKVAVRGNPKPSFLWHCECHLPFSTAFAVLGHLPVHATVPPLSGDNGERAILLQLQRVV